MPPGGVRVWRYKRKAIEHIAAVFCVTAGFLLTALSAAAQDATWLSNPGSNDLSVGSNWSTGTVPTGTASFGVSNPTTLFSSGFGQTFGGCTFNAGASAYP